VRYMIEVVPQNCIDKTVPQGDYVNKTVSCGHYVPSRSGRCKTAPEDRMGKTVSYGHCMPT
jgi:hypothetical protein